jgi:hypothetical protein
LGIAGEFLEPDFVLNGGGFAARCVFLHWGRMQELVGVALKHEFPTSTPQQRDGSGPKLWKKITLSVI